MILSILGNHFFSGGAENVLVKWFCENLETRHYLPRLPANIVHLSVSEDNQFIAVSTQDNGKLLKKFILLQGWLTSNFVVHANVM